MGAQKFTVGQVLWFPGSRWDGVAREVHVTKVGRVWLTLDGPHNGSRAGMNTMELDGWPTRRLYLSREHWAAEQRANIAWDTLRRNMQFRIPQWMLAETVMQAATLLGLDKPVREALERLDSVQVAP